MEARQATEIQRMTVKSLEKEPGPLPSASFKHCELNQRPLGYFMIQQEYGAATHVKWLEKGTIYSRTSALVAMLVGQSCHIQAAEEKSKCCSQLTKIMTSSAMDSHIKATFLHNSYTYTGNAVVAVI